MNDADFPESASIGPSPDLLYKVGGDAADWIVHELGIPAAEYELGVGKELYPKEIFIPISITTVKKTFDENLNWLEHIYEKIGNQISIKPLGYKKV